VSARVARYGRTIEARSVLRRFVDSGYEDPEVNGWLEKLASSNERSKISAP